MSLLHAFFDIFSSADGQDYRYAMSSAPPSPFRRFLSLPRYFSMTDMTPPLASEHTVCRRASPPPQESDIS